jgi:Uma2 family endonuclease
MQYMPAAPQISVNEYLATSYDPDREYVEGEVLERNVGEYDHSRPQARLVAFLFARESEWDIQVVMAQRVQASPTRFRIPDVTVVQAGSPIEQVFATPPFLCVEIVSKDDSLSGTFEKIEEYLRMGVPHVWVIDPRRRQGYHFTVDGMREAKDGILRTSNPDLAVPLAALFD